MALHVCRLKIDGFRGAYHADISLGQHTVLVGPNNSGKTTIIEALALLLGRDRLVPRLTEHDFFGSDPDEKSRIVIVATVAGFKPNDPVRHREWFAPDRGVELDPSTGQLHPTKDQDGWLLAVQIGCGARFDIHDLEAEVVRFFVAGIVAWAIGFELNNMAGTIAILTPDRSARRTVWPG